MQGRIVLPERLRRSVPALFRAIRGDGDGLNSNGLRERALVWGHRTRCDPRTLEPEHTGSSWAGLRLVESAAAPLRGDNVSFLFVQANRFFESRCRLL